MTSSNSGKEIKNIDMPKMNKAQIAQAKANANGSLTKNNTSVINLMSIIVSITFLLIVC